MDIFEQGKDCECCIGDEALYWRDDQNNAFIDDKGEILVTVKDHTMRFMVKCCPKCGKRFTFGGMDMDSFEWFPKSQDQ